MKIVLSTSIGPNKGQSLFYGKTNFPPLGLGYIATVLEARGHQVEICDCLASNFSLNEAVTYIARQNPDIVGISVLSIFYQETRQLAALIKKKINVPIILGGPHCSSYPAETLNECKEVDFLIYGEGEFVLSMLLEKISDRGSCYNIPQICFRDGDGKVMVNTKEQLIEDLDIIPFPSRHLFDVNLYRSDLYSFITSRGCSYGRCLFCMRTGFLYERYRRRSVQNVIAELVFFREPKYKNMVFFDDNFAQDEEWIICFCEELLERKMTIKWSCNARVDTVTKKMLQMMARSGCHTIRYGIESGSQDLLNYIKKGISREQVVEAIKITKECGIKTYGYFMLGLPRETPEIGKKTVEFAIDLDLDWAQFVPVRPLRGTKLYDICQKEGVIVDSSYEFYDKKVCDYLLLPKIKFIPNGYLNKDNVVKIIKFAYWKFYFRYSYIRKILTSTKDIKDLIRIANNLWLFIRILFSRLV